MGRVGGGGGLGDSQATDFRDWVGGRGINQEQEYGRRAEVSKSVLYLLNLGFPCPAGDWLNKAITS